ncbi:zinc knuckle [Ostertagia ostertagi]
MEAHQMVHFLNKRKVRVTKEDEEYRLSSQMHMPPPWPEEPESYIQTLRWWRDNYSDALMIRATDEYLQISSMDRRLQEQARGPERQVVQHPAQPLRSIEVPRLEPYTTWPTDNPILPPAVPPQAGQRSTFSSRPGHEPTTLGKRRTNTGDTSRDVEPPRSRSRLSSEYRSPSRSSSRRPQGRPAAPHRSRSAYPRRTVPSESHGRVEPCVFCLKDGHYSSDCDSYPYLSDRAHLAARDGICSNCLKSHFGICIRKDPCSICYEEGHHRAFCVQNSFAIYDVDASPEEFYDQLRVQTYRQPPRGAIPRRRYERSYHDRDRNVDVDQPGPSTNRLRSGNVLRNLPLPAWVVKWASHQPIAMTLGEARI